jgi:hypothetical protein
MPSGCFAPVQPKGNEMSHVFSNQAGHGILTCQLLVLHRIEQAG